ncbi:PhnA domain-containing protein, partial [bacterium]|nr:PhnA domain-containing protein [bacterium]
MIELSEKLKERSGQKCELCTKAAKLSVFCLEDNNEDPDKLVVLCSSCESLINEGNKDESSWSFLAESMWSEHFSVKLLSYCILNLNKSSSWANDLLEQFYFEPEEKLQAKSIFQLKFAHLNNSKIIHKDCNGQVLCQGDSVNLIKNLDVKGTSFTA